MGILERFMESMKLNVEDEEYEDEYEEYAEERPRRKLKRNMKKPWAPIIRLRESA